MGFKPFSKRFQIPPLLLLPCEDSVRRWLSRNQKASKTMRNKPLLFTSHPVYGPFLELDEMNTEIQFFFSPCIISALFPVPSIKQSSVCSLIVLPPLAYISVCRTVSELSIFFSLGHYLLLCQ